MLLTSGFVEFKLDYDKTQHLVAGKFVSSDNFSAGDYLWRINCFLRRHVIDGNDNKHLSVGLELVSNSKKVEATFDAFLVGRNGKFYSSTLSDRCSYTFDLTDRVFVKRSDLELSYVMNDTVTILCQVTVVHADSTLPAPPPSNLASNLGHLLDCTLGTDVSFNVGGEMLHAHRALLAARSPVFSAELFGPMADATMPSITLQDIHPAAFKVMLRFMYTDALPPDDELGDPPVEMLQHLLAAADRFALDRLKVLCELRLWDNTSVTTIASVLTCAETYNCPKLKTKCMDFLAVQENFNEAVFTDGFAMLLQKFPALAAELRMRNMKYLMNRAPVLSAILLALLREVAAN